MNSPVVDDASQVVEIIRQKSPSSELNMALQDQKTNIDTDTDTDMPIMAHQEEKKEDDNGTMLAKNESYVEEEGQEALWIDVASAGESAKRSLFKRTTTTPTTPQQMHVLLLDQKPGAAPPPPPPPPQVDTAKQRQAALKADTARKLLEQALCASANVGSRELLAQSAFRQATDARLMLEQHGAATTASTTRTMSELQALLQDACQKGQAAAAVARQLQLKKNAAAATPTLDEGDEASMREAPPLVLLDEVDGRGSADEHASRARQYLEFILPVVLQQPVGSMRAAAVEQMDDMSTLGFDNTFEEAASPTGGRDNFDILSMSSLNEILDGPMEVSPERKSKAVSTKVDDNHKKKRGRLFGGLFKKKELAPKSHVVDASNATMKVTGIKSAAGKKRNTPKKAKDGTKGTETEIKRFVATVMVEDGDDRNLNREISNVEELKKYQAVDEELERQLLEAMSHDDTESVMSLEGIKMHGKQTKPKQKAKDGSGMEEEEEFIHVRSPPRDNKPMFVSVPKGTPAILMQQSWESLVENEAVPLIEDAPKTHPRPREQPPKVYRPAPMTEAQAALDPVPSRSPASTTANGSVNDKYIVPEQLEPDDRYAVEDDDCHSLEALWDTACAGGGLKMVRDESGALVPANPQPTALKAVNSDDQSGIPAPPKSSAVVAPVKQQVKTPPRTKASKKLRGFGSVFGKKANTPVKEKKAPDSAAKAKSVPKELLESAKKANTPIKEKKAPDSAAKAKSVSKELLESAKKANTPVKEKKAPDSAAKAKSAPKALESAKKIKPAASSTKSKSKASPSKAAPLASVASNQTSKDRKAGLFGRWHNNDATELKRETSAIRPVNINVITTDSPTESSAPIGVSFSAADSFEENEDSDPLVAQIKQQQNRQRRGRGIDPATKGEPVYALRGIDP